MRRGSREAAPYYVTVIMFLPCIAAGRPVESVVNLCGFEVAEEVELHLDAVRQFNLIAP